MVTQVRCCFPLLLCIVGASAYVETISGPPTTSLQSAPNANLTFRNSGRQRAFRTPFTSSPTLTAVDWAYPNRPGSTIAMGPESASAAPTERVLYSFQGDSDGDSPYGGLIADSSGNLYGTTAGGGTSGVGTVFKLSPSGTKTVLHTFAGGFDGYSPLAPLIADSSGNLYGTTQVGGASRCSLGCGVVFRVSADGTSYVILHFFKGGSDGALPDTGLVADSSGNLYGTTNRGGGSGCFGDGCGVVFKLSPDGASYTVLYSFTGFGDGGLPSGELIVDDRGNLYGTTQLGGAAGTGVVFRLSPGGTETVLYSFCSKPGCSDGSTPASGLLADGSGNLYGTTFLGGAPGCFGYGCGTVFKLSPDGTETVLHAFCNTDCRDGSKPAGGLIADRAGNLYGTTYLGGLSGCLPEGCGVVFKLSTGGIFTVLHSFTGFPSDGSNPPAGLFADTGGNLYGATLLGGGSSPSSCLAFNGAPLGCGTVFKVAGTGFVVPVAFAGTPGKPNCHGQSVSALAKQYGGMAAVAAALGFPSVGALQDDIRAYCAGG